MRGGSVGRLVCESQTTNMHLVNKWLYVIFGRYGGFRGFSLLPTSLGIPLSSSLPPFSLVIGPLTLTRPRRGVKDDLRYARRQPRAARRYRHDHAQHNVISRSISHRGEWLVTIRACAWSLKSSTASQLE